MRNLLLGTVAIAALAAAPAVAADMRVKAPVYKSAPVTPYFSWTGCYVGGNIGGAWAYKSVSDPLGTFFPLVPGQSLGSHDASGFVGGGQVGCDYQVGTWVVGLQGMFEWTDMIGNNPQPGGVGVFHQTQIPWFTTATGRIGYTPTLTTLVYLKGGGAWVRDNYTSYVPGAVLIASGGGSRSGWTVGGGIEQGTGTGWTAFIEYNYLNFGTNTVTFNSYAAPAFQFPVDVRQDMHMVVFGVNYRFSAGRY